MKRNIFIIILIVFNIAADQVSKALVRAKMLFYPENGDRAVIDVIGSYFQLLWVENKGAFLGMGSDMNEVLRVILLLILPTIVLLYVIYYIIKNKDLSRLNLVAFCCIIGGGIANVYDRIFLGSVTDFFFINLGGIFKTGIFNMADLSVTTGMIILLLSGLIFNKKENETTHLPEPTQNEEQQAG